MDLSIAKHQTILRHLSKGVNEVRVALVSPVCPRILLGQILGGPMARVELTDAKIKSFVTEKRVDLVDTLEPGLTLRVTPSGVKTWAVRARSADGTPQRVTLGQYPDISLRNARKEAGEKRQSIRKSVGNVNQILRDKEQQASEAPTLRELVSEYALLTRKTHKVWQLTKRGHPSEAEKRILTVFAPLYDRRVTDIIVDELSRCMENYQPKSGKTKANGQVSRARAYLMPVLDWSAGRGNYTKAGKRRQPMIESPDMHETHDPASDDYDIKGERERVLDHDELVRILPLLIYPAPKTLNLQMSPVVDVRPVAHRFILLTAARLDEVVSMRWGDVDIARGIWTKPKVKVTRGPPRKQVLPLSNAALNLLKSLPGFEGRTALRLCFPNSVNNEIENWDRVTTAIQIESRTDDWTRHDLRRTSSTILELIGIAPRVIDRILAHKVDNKSEGTSRALNHYIRGKNVLKAEDPQKVALDKLAEVYADIEAGVTDADDASNAV